MSTKKHPKSKFDNKSKIGFSGCGLVVGFYFKSKLASIIRNSLKVLFFKAFRRIALERRQPFIVLSHQKSN